MEVKFLKVVDHTKEWKNAKGEMKPSTGFYAVVNIEGKETWLKFQPTKFSYPHFNLISEVRIKKNEQ